MVVAAVDHFNADRQHAVVLAEFANEERLDVKLAGNCGRVHRPPLYRPTAALDMTFT